MTERARRAAKSPSKMQFLPVPRTRIERHGKNLIAVPYPWPLVRPSGPKKAA